MPTYEYKCIACGELFEYFQKMTDEPVKKCEKCGGDLKKLISAGIGPIFKGSGFYQTDYKGSGKDTFTKEKSENTETKKKDSTKSDKKAS